MTGLLAACLAAACLLLAGRGAVMLVVPPDASSFAAQAPPSPALVERAVLAVGAPVARVLARWDRPYRRWVARLLADAGRRDMSVDAFAARQAGTAVLTLAVVLWSGLLGMQALAASVLLVVPVVPLAALWREAGRRQARIERDLAPFLELMAVLLTSGLTFRHALARVVPRLRGPLEEELRLFLAQLEFGWTPDDALADLDRRSSAPTVSRLVATARQNLALGVPVGQVLTELADDVRSDAVVSLKLRAQRAADQAALVLVFLALPGSLGIAMTVVLNDALDTFSGFTP